MMAALVNYAGYSTVVMIVLGVLAAQLVWLLTVTILLMVSRGRLDSAQRAIKRLNTDVKAAGRMRRDRAAGEPVTTPGMLAAPLTDPLGKLGALFPPSVPVPPPVPAPPPVEVQWHAEPGVPTNPIRHQPLRPNGRHSATDRRESRTR